MIDRAGLAQFVRRRREAVQPEDVGLPRGPRRRTGGLRREEVAALCHMSVDYYSRIEQRRGPQPSEQMVSSIAQGLHLTLDERDHLFRLAGHQPPARGASSDHVGPGMLRILDRLVDTPAEIVSELGESLRQTPLAVALFGDATGYVGLDRIMGFRWFTRATARDLFPPEDHDYYSRFYVSGLRGVAARRGPESRAAQLTAQLVERSEEFRSLWERHEVGVRPREVKRYQHPVVGPLELQCQTLHDPEQSHVLLVYTATPGTESYERLRLLSTVGSSMG